jgi:hypothetical protein
LRGFNDPAEAWKQEIDELKYTSDMQAEKDMQMFMNEEDYF